MLSIVFDDTILKIVVMIKQHVVSKKINSNNGLRYAATTAPQPHPGGVGRSAYLPGGLPSSGALQSRLFFLFNIYMIVYLYRATIALFYLISIRSLIKAFASLISAFTY